MWNVNPRTWTMIRPENVQIFYGYYMQKDLPPAICDIMHFYRVQLGPNIKIQDALM